jgi:tetratricopeptide (TPR) repeat protein
MEKSKGLLADFCSRGPNTIAMDAYRRLCSYTQALWRSLRGIQLAVSNFETALSSSPDYVEALNNLGAALIDLGKAADALVHLARAVDIRPGFAEALMNHGNALAAVGHLDEAAAQIERALQRRPDYAEAEMHLGRIHLEAKRPAIAITHLQRALRLRPDYPDALIALGNALSMNGQHDEAFARFEKALGISPKSAEAEIGYAAALIAVDRRREALLRCERAIGLRPEDAHVARVSGAILLTVGHSKEAIPHLEKALLLRPDYADAHYNLGRAFQLEYRYDEALEQYDQALALKPDLIDALEGRGNALLELGHVDKARNAFEQVLVRDPHRAQAYLYLVNSTKIPSDSVTADSLRQFSRDMTPFKHEERKYLHFALGKVAADAGEMELSFDHYLKGNALMRQEIQYAEKAALAQIESIKSVFTPTFMRRFRDCGTPSAKPIFIVGMPRSGSTLIEQILAGHPQIFAAGERLDFHSAMHGCKLDSRVERFPEGADALDGTMLRQLGGAYLSSMSAFETSRRRHMATPAQRFTDKMLQNFLYLGLIYLALPNARIIHARRDPIDTCLSCFSLLFFGDQPYSYDLGELGRYYRAYAGLMDHWHNLLPPATLLEVNYCDTVMDLETQARRIVAHCDLDWDNRCLAFHETARPVRTASVSQVRRPLYRDSLRRWRPDPTTLAPLLDGLNLEAAEQGTERSRT